MTKINKMVVQGFKSFAKRTELTFGDKFNCVLGPNGSGKSNILDALCFVLGKSSAKALRSEKSANLIYNGGKTKKPSKNAEVSIFFDNHEGTFPTEDKEVKVTRLVRKNGSSVYKINDETRTRQQIVELLSLARINPDSYSIILQGDIVSFVNMPPEERRLLIEDISGISIYEEKKQKAVSELDRVDEKLKEVGIILSERENSVKELKKEREHAFKHKDLNDRIKINKASLLWKQISRKQEEKADFEKKIGSQRENLGKKQEEAGNIKENIKKSKEEIDSINKEIETRGDRESVSIHKEIEKLRVDIASSKNRTESISNEIKKIDDRKSQLQQNEKDIGAKIKKTEDEKAAFRKQADQCQKELAVIDRKIADFKKKNNLDNAADIEKDVDALDKKAEEKQKEIMELRQRQQDLLREKDRLEFQIQSIDEKITKVLEVQKENKAQIEELKEKRQEFKKATLELNTKLNEDSLLASQLENARQNLLRISEELSKLNARNISIQENLGADLAVKEILRQKDRMGGIYGMVSELGQVSSRYSLALEIAAGHKIKSIVVSDDKTAANCIKYLKEKKLGVATFLPLNKISSKPIPPGISEFKKTNGVHGLAMDLVSFEPKFKNVFGHVFGASLVVDNIDVARRIGIGNAKMVTLEGDLTETRGVMQGGYRKRKALGMGFQEKEVGREIENFENHQLESQSLVARLEKTRKENESSIGRLRQFKANLEVDIIKLEKTLNIDSSDLDASKKARQDFSSDLTKTEKEEAKVQLKVSDLNKELADNRVKRQQLRQKVTELRSPILIAELNAFEEKKKQLNEQVLNANSEIKGLDSQIVNILAPELENISKIVKQHDKEQSDFKSESSKLNDLVSRMHEELKEKEEKQKTFHEQFKGLFTKRTKTDDLVKKHELKLEELNNQTKDIEIRANTFSVELAKVNAELSAFENEFRQYEGVEIVKNRNEADLRKEIGTCEGVLTKMGAVNMKSLEIYDAAEKEYNNLQAKKEKLAVEKEDVLIMMNEIEARKKDMFAKTFEIVNKNFQTFFGLLSTKGDAFLELENPESPFEQGVLVKVRITGERFMDIRSLSGGEKTLTALAFIFAIQEHEPASFYIMDEVDAALDKRNSERLAQLIKKYTERAQYIVISHNDSVISEADTLYGISMDEHGVSNVTSLKL